MRWNELDRILNRKKYISALLGILLNLTAAVRRSPQDWKGTLLN